MWHNGILCLAYVKYVIFPILPIQHFGIYLIWPVLHGLAQNKRWNNLENSPIILHKYTTILWLKFDVMFFVFSLLMYIYCYTISNLGIKTCVGFYQYFSHLNNSRVWCDKFFWTRFTLVLFHRAKSPNLRGVSFCGMKTIMKKKILNIYLGHLTFISETFKGCWTSSLWLEAIRHCLFLLVFVFCVCTEWLR